MVIGHEKGDDTASRLKHNFGMGKPEGYRKAIRLMQLADRFGLPVMTLVDTSGAFPGVQAEERGQAEAIARSTEQCLKLGVPLIAAILGEGGSGGAMALAAGNTRADDGACGLFGDLARGLRLDPVAHRRQGRRRRRGDEGHRAGSEGARRDRQDRRRAAGRRASRSGARRSLALGDAMEASLDELDGVSPEAAAEARAAANSSRWGGSSPELPGTATKKGGGTEVPPPFLFASVDRRSADAFMFDVHVVEGAS